MPTPPPPEALLRLEAVKARTGLSRSLIYRLIAEASFPRAIHIAKSRVSVWPSSAIDAWVKSQIEEAA